MAPKPRHREVWVDLRDKTDRMAIIGKVSHEMRTRAVPAGEVDAFREAAHKSQTHDDLMETCRAWVQVSE